jgi:hypothetical protein
MHEGLYAIEFHLPTGKGYGVVVIAGGHIRGGDSTIFYVGEYQLTGDNFSATATTGRHAPGQALFGRDVVHITLNGSFSGHDGKFKGSAAEAPGLVLNGALKLIGP